MGRETQLRSLRDALARAGIGLRQSVLVRGPSGMGKSALMVGFRQLEQSREAEGEGRISEARQIARRAHGVEASRVPDHAGTGRGAAKRRGPTGGAA